MDPTTPKESNKEYPAKESAEYSFAVRGKLKVKDNGKSFRKLATEELTVYKEKKAAKKVKKDKKKAKKEAKALKKAVLMDKYMKESGEFDSKALLTESQKKQEKVYAAREQVRIEEGAHLSHKDRVKDMNIKLHQMSEIHDIPKCSWTK